MTVPVSDIAPGVDVKKFEYRDISAATGGKKLSYRQNLKRFLDVVLVLAAAPIVLPLTALLALIVAIDGGAPFYTQKRVGRGGQVFRMFKLRTMVANADTLLEEYLAKNPAAKAEWDSTQKLKNDPRITAFGRFLRQTSLDELPQLFNVLRGDMSIVGPRPMMESQVPLYPGHAYYRLRPGLTGPWQVSDRNACEFSDRATFDDAYDRGMSLRTDAGIVYKTVGVMFRATGY